MKPLLFVFVLAAVPSKPPVEITISAQKGPLRPDELKTKEMVLGFHKRHDLSKYTLTNRIVIEAYAVPHSHPVLTLNTRHNKDADALLATYLHEQIHWHEESHKSQVDEVIRVLKKRYPKVPTKAEGGANDIKSTYLHFVVNSLELFALRKHLGDKRAYDVMRKKDIYPWIYREITEDETYFRKLLKKHGLLIEP